MVNVCQFVGRVGKAPEVRYTASGQCVASLSLAVSEKYKDKSGEKVEKTEWIPCIFWGKLGEIIAEYVGSGDLLWCSGKFTTRKWQDKDGRDRYTSEINCSDMKMLGGKGGSKDGGKPRSGGDGSRTYDSEPVFNADDDIPFLCAPGMNDPY